MRVTSNGVALSTAPSAMRTSRLDDPQALRENFRRDGYVLLRQVLDRDTVIGLRGAYFGMFDPSYLAKETTPQQGIWSGEAPAGLPPHGHPGHPAHAFVRSKVFADFVQDQRLLAVAQTLFDGAETMRLPRQIVRHFHQGPRASRAHTDFDYLDRGSDQVLTMWIPIGDCPVPTGGIAYLEGSHRLPKAQLQLLKNRRTDRPDDPRPISHDLGWTQQELGGRWLCADFAAGDVAIHSPHLVHATFDTTTSSMRMSADIRFVPIDVEPDPRWLRPWSGDDGN
ncbi:phytanoyl-CoA dioxygenase [Rhizocola hellebori]|uniref:Phytanoyl-CoA dioxygenase n=1 Tax=Rhizocola hellebori TaxID=1392758 RepID=A0A8J3Q5D3_9ACTN|nr:phytanoyl-CoA dioxygenase family protein [Rhizocola hellebori]GIH03737.1 phytanoyl-CoA dioxygenase [Rhizocola hellebori]